MKQISFFKQSLSYGGNESLGKKHVMRPLCSKRVLHMVLKSSDLENRFPGVSLTKGRNIISEILEEKATKHNIKIYEYSINFNHMHLALKFKRRKDYVRFIRAVTSHIVIALSRFFDICLTGLFDLSPWSRVVAWGRSFKSLIDYININKLEAERLISRLKQNTNTKKTQR